MKQRYVLYALVIALASVFFVFTSYGVLLLASMAGVALLAASVMVWALLFSASERLAHSAVRMWNAVVPAQFSSMLFRQKMS